jgi:hypothetical protein
MSLVGAYKNPISFLLGCPEITLITGTAGVPAERAMVESFHVLTVIVPRFKKRQYKELPIQVITEHGEWKKAIIEKVCKNSSFLIRVIY